MVKPINSVPAAEQVKLLHDLQVLRDRCDRQDTRITRLEDALREIIDNPYAQPILSRIAKRALGIKL